MRTGIARWHGYGPEIAQAPTKTSAARRTLNASRRRRLPTSLRRSSGRGPGVLLQRQIALAVCAVPAGDLFLRNYGRRGHLVAFFHAHQPHALRGPAGLADLARFDANDLAVARDDHQVGVFFHREDRYHFADSGRHLHVDHALAAARREAILLELGALAVTVFGNRQDEAFLLDHLRADDVVAVGQIHRSHAASGTAHGAHIGLMETDGLAFVRAEENVVVAVGQTRPEQLVAFVQGQRDDAPRHRVVELRQFALLDDALH